MKIEIGKTEAGKAINLDTNKLVESRLLITATSGGGKSFTQRMLAEKTDGILPRIILDPEGEFGSLREGFDFVLAGKGGDVPADARTASLLARKSLELNLSLIMDLSELSRDEKHHVVRLFLEGLLDAPKPLWGPRLVFLDEAHIFIPEKGEGSSEARTVGIRLVDSGRKRGLGTILATQRLAKLSKDAAAECWNKMVGPTSWAADRARAADEIGITRKEADIFRTLAPGQFIVAGPALVPDPTKVQMAMATTTHPKAGRGAKAKAMAPGSKIKAVLAKLADLPKEAQEEAKTVDELKAQVKALQTQLRQVPPPPKPVPAKLSDAELAAMRKDLQAQLNKATNEFDRRRIAELKKALIEMRDGVHKVMEQVVKKHDTVTEAPEAFIPKKDIVQIKAIPDKDRQFLKNLPMEISPAIVINQGDEKKFGACELGIAGFLAAHPERAWSKAQVALGSGYSSTSSGFDNAISRLNVAGIISKSSMGLQISLARVEELGLQLKAPANARAAWEANMGSCELALLKTLEANLGGMSKEELCEATINPKTGKPYSPTSSGVDNAISRLNVLEMILKVDGKIRFNEAMKEV